MTSCWGKADNSQRTHKVDKSGTCESDQDGWVYGFTVITVLNEINS